MSKFFFDQPALPLISDADVSQLPINKKYEALFQYLDLSNIKDHNDGLGCSGYSRHSYIKALLFKELEQIPSVPKLCWWLQNQPYLSKYIIGFKDSIPHPSQFYRYLKEFPSSRTQQLIANTNLRTFEALRKKIELTSIDSKPIKANTKENNPKNFNHNLSDKTKKIKRNEHATLGHFSSTNDIIGKIKVFFFWGFRIHIIFGGDDELQLPLIAKLYPNNVMDETVAPRLFRKFKRLYQIKKKDKIIILADKRYDCWEVYEAWSHLFAGSAIIPTNKRNTHDDKTNIPVCDAGQKMIYNGKWYDQNGHRTRFKFRCPEIEKDCIFAKSNYGCTKYRQIRDIVPAKIYPHENLFKKLYPKRQGIERYNATLQKLGQETPNYFGKKAIENTILFAILGTTLVGAHNARNKFLKSQ